MTERPLPAFSTDAAPPGVPARPSPSCAALFLGFLSVAVVAFGGVLPIARRALVERHGWLTADEFTELVGLSQFLPGPNIINLSVIVGARFRGVPGAISAFLGLTAVPAVGVVLAGMAFTRYADIGAVSDMLAGLAAAAAGLVLAMAARMAEPLWRRPRPHTVLIALLAFIGIVATPLSLPVMMLVLAPLSILLSWWAERRA
ncbi:chromate transporter [Ancylobacter sp. SL191]|uniref:chromate transporter n=1 Tax=Ancylobacter sp. SL191 TaxID=2995166 RepID=UPI00226D83B0|nr:chromate transporter [Ancylobacter sp. SL191]WAC28180.1 chromate transporter [Ancylobacter sp. SL191]